MQENSGNRFIESMRRGQLRLAEAPAAFRQIAGVFSDFGKALEEIGQGRIGIACVTRDGHEPIAGDFAPGIPMSVVLISHADPDTPSPIVADLQVSQFGFPVTVAFGGEKRSAFGYEALACLLENLSDSDVFASALAGLLAIDTPASRYQS